MLHRVFNINMCRLTSLADQIANHVTNDKRTRAADTGWTVNHFVKGFLFLKLSTSWLRANCSAYGKQLDFQNELHYKIKETKKAQSLSYQWTLNSQRSYTIRKLELKPIPIGPRRVWSTSIYLLWTIPRNSNTSPGFCGTSKSGHLRNWYCVTIRRSLLYSSTIRRTINESRSCFSCF